MLCSNSNVIGGLTTLRFLKGFLKLQIMGRPQDDDARFQRLNTDPIFRKVKKDDSKLKIDARFASVFLNDEFKTATKIDKYGRPNKKEDNNLHRFYKLDDDVPENDLRPDIARGEGDVESSDDEVDVEMESDIDIEFFFNDENIPRGDETARFACVNMDWDHVKAKHLFKVFDGFKPKHGTIKSVKIYLSDFGRERLAAEADNGPPVEIFADNTGPLIKEDNGDEFNSKALRKYQLERLRYYYAIVETDSIETAKSIYESCDGTEFESSANFMDLRYVPDSTTFDDKPVDEARDAPLNYDASDFITPALQHSNVKLTWDAEDPERSKITRRKFTNDDLSNMDFKAYLASESDEEIGDDVILKYQSLVAEADQEKPCEGMEITFTPGLTDKAEKHIEELKEKEVNDLLISIETKG